MKLEPSTFEELEEGFFEFCEKAENCRTCKYNKYDSHCSMAYTREQLLKEFQEHEIITLFKALDSQSQQDMMIKISKLYFDGKKAF